MYFNFFFPSTDCCLSLSGVGGKGGKKKKTKAASKPSKANGSNWANVPLPPPPVHPLPGTEIDHYPNEHHEVGGYVCKAVGLPWWEVKPKQDSG